ncbi:UMP kinase [Patescibacteria group bacterium]|nr:UMP kinase [Patescibacteria group bacterium]
MKKEAIVISLGGSLVVPGEIDTSFLKKFKSIVLGIKNRIYLYVGGGKTARIYQKAGSAFKVSNEEKDRLGILASRINAELVRQVFKSSEVINDPSKKISSKKRIIVLGAWKPGRSTDYGSVVLAKNVGARTIINLTNIDYVRDKDPREFKDAKPLKSISWKDFRKIIPKKWSPGLSSPFDPEASKMAERLKLKVIIINGKNLDRLEDFLNNKPFIGTIIS